MKRRDFIKAGTAATTAVGAVGMATLAGPSCSSLPSGTLPGDMSDPLPDMDSYLDRVDRGMRFISETDWSSSVKEQRQKEDIEVEIELSRKVLRSIYMAGMFGDLPDEGQVHPGMQERMRRALPEMDEAFIGVTDYLSRLTPEETADMRRFLREREDPGMEIAEQLDRHAAESGVSMSRRLQTRSMVTQMVSRMRNQPPELLFDEYMGKVQKLAERSGTVEQVQRQMAARTTREAFFARQQRLAMFAKRWEAQGVTAGAGVQDAGMTSEIEAADAGAASADVEDKGERDQARSLGLQEARDRLYEDLKSARQGLKSDRAREKEIERQQEGLRNAGGWLLGIGTLCVSAGAFLVTLGEIGAIAALVLGPTVGGPLLITALVVIIVRAIKKRKEARG